MTARVERAVRVVPGTIADRQDPIAGDGQTVDGYLSPEVLQLRRGIDVSRSESRTPSEVLKSTALKTLNPRLEANLRRAVQGTRQAAARNHSSLPLGACPRGSLRDALPLISQLGRHRGSFEILILLYEEDPGSGRSLTSPYQMRRRLRIGQEAIDGALGCLVQLGLITPDPQQVFPFAKRYRLTERGTAIVERPLHSWSLVFPE
jgi:DNA-binding HxlR family transcriptional regulator